MPDEPSKQLIELERAVIEAAVAKRKLERDPSDEFFKSNPYASRTLCEAIDALIAARELALRHG